MKSNVHVILFVVSALAAQAQVPICNGLYNLVTTMTEPDCNGGQGQVTLSVQNYTGIFKAKWLADGDEVLSKSLYAGTYSYKVWIPGVPGCSNIGESPSYSVDVTQPTPVVPNASIKSYPTCAPLQAPSGPDGILKVVPTGGTSNFQYKVDWDPVTGSTAFQNGTSFTSGDYERLGTGPGIYYVAVRDDNGCLGQESVTMPSGIPVAMTINANVTNPSCAGQKGGITLLIGNGANLPLRYSLLNPSDVTDTIATNTVGAFINMDEGTYKASVTDQAGCTIQDNSVGIAAPNPLQYSVVDATDVRCYGESDASVTVSISGGTKNYSAYFNDLSHNQIISLSSMNSSGTNLKYFAFQRAFPSGDYYSYLIDAGGCISDSSYFTISEPISLNTSGTLSLTEQKSNACYPGTNSGEILIQGSGAYPAYEFALWNGDRTGSPRLWDLGGYGPSWSNSNGTNTTGLFENLSPSTYTIGVKDQYGCQRRKLVTIGTQPEILVTQQSLTSVDCNSSSTGSISVSASGGLAPLTYELLPAGTQQTSPTFTGLAAGPYQIKVKDDYGCESGPLSFDIMEPDVLVANLTNKENAACNPGSGRIFYTISGGVLNYQVLINGSVSQTISTLKSGYQQNIAQGNYTFNVKDGNGCESTLENFTITGPPSPGANGSGLSVSVGSFQNVTCPSGTDGFIQLSIQGGWPTAGSYTITVETITNYVDRLGYPRINKTPYLTTNNSLINNLPAGNYEISVKDSYGCRQLVPKTIVQPEPIVPSFNGISGNCGGSGNSGSQANGGVTLNSISGGTPPYFYTMNGTPYPVPNTPNFFPNLNLSGVNMIITDNNNCIRYYP